jgi:hypothetical protein
MARCEILHSFIGGEYAKRKNLYCANKNFL